MRSIIISALVALVVGAGGGGWFFYDRGSLAATKKLNALHEDVLKARADDLAFAIGKFEEAKNENDRLREFSRAVEKTSNERRAALDIALNSLRIIATAEGGGSAVPGATGSTTELDAAAEKYRVCAAEFEAVMRGAAHDALTVLEWQRFYEGVRTGDFSVPP